MIWINPDIGYKCPIDFLNKYSKKYSDLGTSYAVILPKTIKKICGILCENQLLYSLKLAYFNDVNDEMIFFTHSKILILLIKFFSKIC
jgi:hypothetical protein